MTADVCRLRHAIRVGMRHGARYFSPAPRPLSMTPPLQSTAREWIESAERDVAVADDLARLGHWEACAFHAQQAAEKALKAVIIQRERRLDTTHDLVKLARDAKAGPALVSCAEFLRPFYWGTRYPDAGGGVPPEDALEAVQFAKEVVRWCSTETS